MTEYTHQTAPTQFAEANGIRFGYRRFGKPNAALHWARRLLLSSAQGLQFKDRAQIGVASRSPGRCAQRLYALRRALSPEFPAAAIVDFIP
jgi:hypothetical protein